MDHPTPSSHNIATFLITIIAGIAGESIDQLNAVLGLILKVTSLISFFLFLFINWETIKERTKETFGKLKKKS